MRKRAKKSRKCALLIYCGTNQLNLLVDLLRATIVNVIIVLAPANMAAVDIIQVIDIVIIINHIIVVVPPAAAVIAVVMIVIVIAAAVVAAVTKILTSSALLILTYTQDQPG
ncbi:hypothetical protein EVAR_73366_1, partial [Eumeta japonica]